MVSLKITITLLKLQSNKTRRSDDGTMLVASSSDGYCSIIEVGDIGEPFDCEALNSPSKNETSGNSGKKSDEDCQAMEVDEEKTKKTPEKEATLIAVRR